MLFLVGSLCLARGEDTLKIKENEEEFDPEFILIEDEELIDISSTLVRNKIENNEEIDDKLVHKDVVEYLSLNLDIFIAK